MSYFEILTEYPVADLEKKSKKFSQYMWSRNLPVESEVLRQKAQELEEDVLQKGIYLLLSFHSLMLYIL